MQPGLFDDIDDILEITNSDQSNVICSTSSKDSQNMPKKSSIPDIEPDVLDKVDEYIRLQNSLFTDENPHYQLDGIDQFELVDNSNRIEYNHPECVICSDDLTCLPSEHIGYLDICNHIFCFKCIVAWSKRTNICPLCKRRFRHIRKLSRSDLIIDNKKISLLQNSGEIFLVEDRSLLSNDNQVTESGCEICGNDNDWSVMLLCDECDKCFHIYCLSPPLSSVPSGLWFCSQCNTSTDPTYTSRATVRSTRTVLTRRNSANRTSTATPSQPRSYSSENHTSTESLDDISDLSDITEDVDNIWQDRRNKSRRRSGSRTTRRRNKRTRTGRSDRVRRRTPKALTPIQALGRSFRTGTQENIAPGDSVGIMLNRERVLTSRLSSDSRLSNKDARSVSVVQSATESRLLRFMNYEYQKYSKIK